MNRRCGRPLLGVLATIAIVLLPAAGAPAAAGDVVLVGDPRGDDLDGVHNLKLIPSASGSGRFVAYLRDDAGAGIALLFRDMREKDPLTIAAPSGPSTTLGGYDAASPSVSADGRYVVFNSKASNLSPEDSDRDISVFRYQVR